MKTLYDTINEYYQYENNIIEMMNNHVIYYDLVEVYCNRDIITIHGISKANPEMNLTFITNRIDLITKESLLCSLGLDPRDEYYFDVARNTLSPNVEANDYTRHLLSIVQDIFDEDQSGLDAVYDYISYSESYGIFELPFE